MKKLNWPEFVELQTPEQLICYKENKMIELDSLTNFTKPVEKKRCDFGENMCFSYVAHVELEDEKFVQYAVRGVFSSLNHDLWDDIIFRSFCACLCV